MDLRPIHSGEEEEERAELPEYEKLAYLLLCQEEFPFEQVRKQATTLATYVLRDWARLNAILKRHERSIRERWSAKTQSEKETMLREIYPRIAARHRPEMGDKALINSKTKKLFAPTDRMLWPYINNEDLLLEGAFPTLLNARGR
jgi:hypothetical protein